MLMLGIDPGLQCTGWGVVRLDANKLTHIAHGQLRTTQGRSDAERLNEIHDGLAEVIATYQPDASAIEAIFVAKGALSAIKLGMARGVAMQTCADAGLPMAEIAARQVKKAVTGTGTADKNQIQAMIARLLNITPKGADAADALAIAIAAANSGGAASASKSVRGRISTGVGLEAAIAAALEKDTSGGPR